MVEPDHMVLAAPDLDAGAAWLEQRLGVALSAGGRHARMGTHNRLLGLGEILSMERGDYRWRISVPSDGHLPGDGLVPTLIQWDVPFHPAQRLPDAGCRLMKLEGFHPQPARIRTALARLGLGSRLDVHACAAAEPAQLVAYLRTPSGLVELD